MEDDLLLLKNQDILTRVVAQEQENALMQNELADIGEAAKQAASAESASRAELDAVVEDIVSLCMQCAIAGCDASKVASVLMESGEAEEAAAKAFAAEVQAARVSLMRRRCSREDRLPEDTWSPEQQELIDRAAEAEAEREREEIQQMEQECAELERRTEVSTLRYAGELFDVRLD